MKMIVLFGISNPRNLLFNQINYLMYILRDVLLLNQRIVCHSTLYYIHYECKKYVISRYTMMYIMHSTFFDLPIYTPTLSDTILC